MLRRIYVQINFFLLLLPVSSFSATGFIDTPDQCLAMERVDKPIIHLKRIGKCDGKPGRIFVEANAGEKLKIFVEGVFWSDQVAKILEIADVTTLLDQAERAGQDLKITKNPHSKAMQQAAEDSKSIYDSPDFQARLKAETERIKEATIGDRFDDYYKDAVKERAAGLGRDERLYIFVSASMPMPVLRIYAAEVARLKDRRVSLVLKGFIGGMAQIVPTVNFVAGVLKKEDSCSLEEGSCDMLPVDLIVDPLLYRKYGISRVPSFVYVKGLKMGKPDMSEGSDDNISEQGEPYQLSGDAGLKYIIQQFGDVAGAQSLKNLAQKL